MVAAAYLGMRTGRPKKPLEIVDADREKLNLIARRPKSAQSMAMRARIVLSCGQGMTNSEVARKLHITGATVGKWRRRFIEFGMDGLLDEPRREMNVIPRMPCQPAAHLGDLVRAVVVHYQVHFNTGRKIGLDLIEKPQEFLMPVPPVARADGHSGSHIHCRKQRCDSMALVVVRLPRRHTRGQRKNRLRPIQPAPDSSHPHTARSHDPADSGTAPQYPAPSQRMGD